MIIYHVLDTHAILYQLRKSITPPSSGLFCIFFLFDRIDPQAVYTSRIRGAFVHHATGNISPDALNIFTLIADSSVFALSPFLYLVCMCVYMRIYVSLLVSTWQYATRPHVVMFSEACDISCHASRTLQRHASRAPRSSPRIHISSGNAS